MIEMVIAVFVVTCFLAAFVAWCALIVGTRDEVD